MCKHMNTSADKPSLFLDSQEQTLELFLSYRVNLNSLRAEPQLHLEVWKWVGTKWASLTF